MHNKPLVFKRRLAKDKRGHYRLSIPSELADFLGLNNGGDVAIVPDNGFLILRAWSEGAV